MAVVRGLPRMALITVDGAEVEQGISLTDPVAEFAGQRESLLEVVGDLRIVALLPIDAPKVVQRVGFGDGSPRCGVRRADLLQLRVANLQGAVDLVLSTRHAAMPEAATPPLVSLPCQTRR